jgi:hypothetical protein
VIEWLSPSLHVAEPRWRDLKLTALTAKKVLEIRDTTERLRKRRFCQLFAEPALISLRLGRAARADCRQSVRRG